ncbi:MAG: nucleotidyltransferase family protein [Thermodesulfobacteriota bacterium]
MIGIDEIKKTLLQLKPKLEEKYQVKEIGIFGSYVRDEQTNESDIDVLVEFSTPVSLLKIISLENYISDILRIKVDIIPKNNIREELKEDILKEAVLV